MKLCDNPALKRVMAASLSLLFIASPMATKEFVQHRMQGFVKKGFGQGPLSLEGCCALG
ncbi:MAG: hypothetical protein ACP5I4_16140 [Oceanipulchritudo sp.]